MVEGGAVGRSVGAPNSITEALVASIQSFPLARVEPVLRVVEPVPATVCLAMAAAPAAIRSAPVAPAPDPEPIRLTAVVQSPGPAPSAPRRDDSPAAAAAAAVEPVDGCWTGAALRSLREARQLTLAELAERTKVTRYHLENIEAGEYAKLPAYVYLRGILLSVAKELRVDGQRVCRTYIELAREAVEGGAR
jgi:hypothetical protein